MKRNCETCKHLEKVPDSSGTLYACWYFLHKEVKRPAWLPWEANVLSNKLYFNCTAWESKENLCGVCKQKMTANVITLFPKDMEPTYVCDKCFICAECSYAGSRKDAKQVGKNWLCKTCVEKAIVFDEEEKETCSNCGALTPENDLVIVHGGPMDDDNLKQICIKCLDKRPEKCCICGKTTYKNKLRQCCTCEKFSCGRCFNIKFDMCKKCA